MNELAKSRSSPNTSPNRKLRQLRSAQMSFQEHSQSRFQTGATHFETQPEKETNSKTTYKPLSGSSYKG